MSKVLVLRTCNHDMTSHGGFEWPTEGSVEALDWKDDHKCGHGLHGALWGEGDGSLFVWSPTARWLVVAVEEDDIRNLGGKVKFPKGSVVFCGDQFDATSYLAERAPGPCKAIIGATITVGDYGTAIAGYCGVATTGDRGFATVGHHGVAATGDYGTATAGIEGIATTGYCGIATAGDCGIATVGDCGIASVGIYGTAAAGKGGEIRIRWWDGYRYRLAVGCVGENVRANTLYRCSAGIFVKAEEEPSVQIPTAKEVREAAAEARHAALAGREPKNRLGIYYKSTSCCSPSMREYDLGGKHVKQTYVVVSASGDFFHVPTVRWMIEDKALIWD